MNIGILTFHFADNYGAVLQAYALKRFLQLHGKHNITIINYISTFFEKAYSINPFDQKDKKLVVKAILRYPVKYNQHKKFEDFRAKELGINGHVLNGLYDLNYDVVIVGSDQVWNLDITCNDFNYFLPVTGVKKFTYAASASNSFAPHKHYEQVSKFLSEFERISVREKQLQQIISNDYGIDADLVLDPVFLMDNMFWHCEESKVKGLPEKYILVYALENNKKLEKVALRIKKETGMKIFVIHPLAKHVFSIGKLLNNVGPKEFIWLIENASYIITNSFHAFAFSIIFRKKVFFDYINGTSNRVANMIESVNIPLKYLGEEDVYYVDLENYSEERLEKHIACSKQFITKYILKEE